MFQKPLVATLLLLTSPALAQAADAVPKQKQITPPQNALAASQRVNEDNAPISDTQGDDPLQGKQSLLKYEQAFQDLLPSVRVEGRQYQPMSLSEMMQQQRVPAVSIAIIDNGRLAYVGAFGKADVNSSRSATSETLFQAASISKPVVATAALVLVEQGQLSLDRPVNDQLVSWKVPDHGLGIEPITLRRLLSHTSGLSTSGFSGYSQGAVVPTVLQILNGLPPANNEPVRVKWKPGTEWHYSGGGMTVAQLLITDVTNEPFPELMHRLILKPLGMDRSSFEQPDSSLANKELAVAYDRRGVAVQGGFKVYPELAAAGLWTTPTDLAKWALAISASLSGAADGPIKQSTAKEMLSPGKGGWGLGVSVSGEGDWLKFGHTGSNLGFKSTLIMYPRRGQGVVMLSNGDNGASIMAAVAQALGRILGWPDSGEIIRPLVVSRSTLLARVGKYQGDRGTVQVILSKNSLMIVPPMGEPFEVIAQADDVYISPENGTRMKFETDPVSGRVVAAVGGGANWKRVE